MRQSQTNMTKHHTTAKQVRCGYVEVRPILINRGTRCKP